MRAQAMFSWAKPKPLNFNYVRPLNNPAAAPLVAAVTLAFRIAQQAIHLMMISACRIALLISSAILACPACACRRFIMAVAQAMTKCLCHNVHKALTVTCATLISALPILITACIKVFARWA